ncbi:superoxide dismutase family protein [Paracoccus sp. 1_MG-2023]|uniref:superoxide dismutase family protein n=1 Tax=unclassified Paracoccus (in: a-proteobacteria) TaxID=2688777 RepID=UPI0020916918|nr:MULTISPECIES: superoxide dismutase family protein [unclassified Paracoccus (in: a-proteobacteria)]MDO6669175.1 superoxide dismutase family protein [Paracoccus sp. 1_MG-2023]
MLRITATAFATLIAALPAMAENHEGHGDQANPDMMADAMTADIAGADGTPHGTITAIPTPSGMLHVKIDLTDVPAGIYGAHLHETGLCEGPEFQSAGGHLAGEGRDHGVHAENGPHLGDMPNIHVPDSGEVMVEYFLPDLGAEQIVDGDGTAFMLHSGQDDLESQPSGDAGGRMACAVLAAAE